MAGATRQVPFPSYQDYQAARVFPLVEKSSWVGAAFVLLARETGQPGVDDQAITFVLGFLVPALVGRVGGEEFAVFLPETDRARATEVAQRIRRAVETLSLPMGRAVTVSIGVVEAREGGPDLASLVTEADRRLYLAKGSGRNRVVAEPRV